MKRFRLSKWMGIFMGIFAAFWKGAELLLQKNILEPSKQKNTKAQFQKEEAVGVFQLKYVDCVPYLGPEQRIFIDKAGIIESILKEDTEKQEIGRLKTGSLMKGTIGISGSYQPNYVHEGEFIPEFKIQIVRMPMGTGVWLAKKVTGRGYERNWDEIYIRSAVLA